MAKNMTTSGKLRIGFAGAGAISQYHLDMMRTLLGPLEVEAARVAKVNRALAGEDVAVILMRGRNGLTAVMDGNISAPGYGPMPADRLDNLETLRLMESCYVAAGVKV